MEKQDIISSGLLEMYVLGGASPEEITQIEQWRIVYADVAEELLKIERTMQSYAMTNALKPAASVKNKLFSGLNINSALSAETSWTQPAKIRSIAPWYRTAAAAAILLLIGSSVVNFLFYNKYKDADNKYNESSSQVALLNNRVNNMDHDMGIVRSKYSQPVNLHGLEAAPDAGAKIFWMKNTGEVYVDASNLPATPRGMQYQLWAIIDGKPVSGGMLTSRDGRQYSIQKMKSFGNAQAFAITLETAGGNPQPKGKMYVMGNI